MLGLLGESASATRRLLQSAAASSRADDRSDVVHCFLFGGCGMAMPIGFGLTDITQSVRVVNQSKAAGQSGCSELVPGIYKSSCEVVACCQNLVSGQTVACEQPDCAFCRPTVAEQDWRPADHEERGLGLWRADRPKAELFMHDGRRSATTTEQHERSAGKLAIRCGARPRSCHCADENIAHRRLRLRRPLPATSQHWADEGAVSAPWPPKCACQQAEVVAHAECKVRPFRVPRAESRCASRCLRAQRLLQLIPAEGARGRCCARWRRQGWPQHPAQQRDRGVALEAERAVQGLSRCSAYEPERVFARAPDEPLAQHTRKAAATPARVCNHIAQP